MCVECVWSVCGCGVIITWTIQIICEQPQVTYWLRLSLCVISDRPDAWVCTSLPKVGSVSLFQPPFSRH